MTTNNQTTDPWGGRRDYAGPFMNAFAVVPSDVSPQPMMVRAIYVGVTGNLSVRLRGDTTPVTFYAVPAGTVLNVAAAMIMATGTTASDLIGLV